MRRKNRFWRLVLFVYLAFLVLSALYFVPTRLGIVTLRPIDLLAALRPIQPDSALYDADTLETTHTQADPADSVAQQRAITDSLRNALFASNEMAADSTGSVQKVFFEDYSPDGRGLAHCFRKLIHHEGMLYMAFLGDSFIEADIFTLDVRRMLQQRYGGRGVGWMPLSSGVAGYRRGIRHQFSGWQEFTPLTSWRKDYLLNQHIYRAESARTTYELPAEAAPFQSVSLFYKSNVALPFTLTVGDSVRSDSLPPSTELMCYRTICSARSVTLRIPRAEGALFYGVALDGEGQGVAIDNFSLRSSSGTHLLTLNDQEAGALQRLRPYGLIVLQYGMNVVSQGVYRYNEYEDKLVQTITKLKHDYPNADILIMGISDRAQRRNGEMQSMPELTALRKAQRNAARRCGVLFWDTYQAMGGTNSMLRWVANGWAAKDYTHLSFSGGRELAKHFVDAFLLEETYYRKLGA